MIFAYKIMKIMTFCISRSFSKNVVPFVVPIGITNKTKCFSLKSGCVVWVAKLSKQGKLLVLQ